MVDAVDLDDLPYNLRMARIGELASRSSRSDDLDGLTRELVKEIPPLETASLETEDGLVHVFASEQSDPSDYARRHAGLVLASSSGRNTELLISEILSARTSFQKLAAKGIARWIKDDDTIVSLIPKLCTRPKDTLILALVSQRRVSVLDRIFPRLIEKDANASKYLHACSSAVVASWLPQLLESPRLDWRKLGRFHGGTVLLPMMRQQLAEASGAGGGGGGGGVGSVWSRWTSILSKGGKRRLNCGQEMLYCSADNSAELLQLATEFSEKSRRGVVSPPQLLLSYLPHIIPRHPAPAFAYLRSTLRVIPAGFTSQGTAQVTLGTAVEQLLGDAKVLRRTPSHHLLSLLAHILELYRGLGRDLFYSSRRQQQQSSSYSLTLSNYALTALFTRARALMTTTLSPADGQRVFQLLHRFLSSLLAAMQGDGGFRAALHYADDGKTFGGNGGGGGGSLYKSALTRGQMRKLFRGSNEQDRENLMAAVASLAADLLNSSLSSARARFTNALAPAKNKNSKNNSFGRKDTTSSKWAAGQRRVVSLLLPLLWRDLSLMFPLLEALFEPLHRRFARVYVGSSERMVSVLSSTPAHAYSRSVAPLFIAHHGSHLSQLLSLLTAHVPECAPACLRFVRAVSTREERFSAPLAAFEKAVMAEARASLAHYQAAAAEAAAKAAAEAAAAGDECASSAVLSPDAVGISVEGEGESKGDTTMGEAQRDSDGDGSDDSAASSDSDDDATSVGDDASRIVALQALGKDLSFLRDDSNKSGGARGRELAHSLLSTWRSSLATLLNAIIVAPPQLPSLAQAHSPSHPGMCASRLRRVALAKERAHWLVRNQCAREPSCGMQPLLPAAQVRLLMVQTKQRLAQPGQQQRFESSPLLRALPALPVVPRSQLASRLMETLPLRESVVQQLRLLCDIRDPALRNTLKRASDSRDWYTRRTALQALLSATVATQFQPPPPPPPSSASQAGAADGKAASAGSAGGDGDGDSFDYATYVMGGAEQLSRTLRVVTRAARNAQLQQRVELIRLLTQLPQLPACVLPPLRTTTARQTRSVVAALAAYRAARAEEGEGEGPPPAVGDGGLLSPLWEAACASAPRAWVSIANSLLEMQKDLQQAAEAKAEGEDGGGEADPWGADVGNLASTAEDQLATVAAQLCLRATTVTAAALDHAGSNTPDADGDGDGDGDAVVVDCDSDGDGAAAGTAEAGPAAEAGSDEPWHLWLHLELELSWRRQLAEQGRKRARTFFDASAVTCRFPSPSPSPTAGVGGTSAAVMGMWDRFAAVAASAVLQRLRPGLTAAQRFTALVPLFKMCWPDLPSLAAHFRALLSYLFSDSRKDGAGIYLTTVTPTTLAAAATGDTTALSHLMSLLGVTCTVDSSSRGSRGLLPWFRRQITIDAVELMMRSDQAPAFLSTWIKQQLRAGPPPADAAANGALTAAGSGSGSGNSSKQGYYPSRYAAREAAVLTLLSISPSAIYINLVWQFLVRCRQDLLPPFIAADCAFYGPFYIAPENRTRSAAVGVEPPNTAVAADRHPPAIGWPGARRTRGDQSKRAYGKMRGPLLASRPSQSFAPYPQEQPAAMADAAGDGDFAMVTAATTAGGGTAAVAAAVESATYFVLPACWHLNRLSPSLSKALAAQLLAVAGDDDVGTEERVSAIQRYTLLPTTSFGVLARFVMSLGDMPGSDAAAAKAKKRGAQLAADKAKKAAVGAGAAAAAAAASGGGEAAAEAAEEAEEVAEMAADDAAAAEAVAADTIVPISLPMRVAEAGLRGMLCTPEPVVALPFLLSPELLSSDRARVAAYAVRRALPYVPPRLFMSLLQAALRGRGIGVRSKPQQGAGEGEGAVVAAPKPAVLRVTAHKELLRLMVSLPNGLRALARQWDHGVLHRDVRVVILQTMLSVLLEREAEEAGAASTSDGSGSGSSGGLGGRRQEVREEIAWGVLEKAGRAVVNTGRLAEPGVAMGSARDEELGYGLEVPLTLLAVQPAPAALRCNALRAMTITGSGSSYSLSSPPAEWLLVGGSSQLWPILQELTTGNDGTGSGSASTPVRLPLRLAHRYFQRVIRPMLAQGTHHELMFCARGQLPAWGLLGDPVDGNYHVTAAASPAPAPGAAPAAPGAGETKDGAAAAAVAGAAALLGDGDEGLPKGVSAAVYASSPMSLVLAQLCSAVADLRHFLPGAAEEEEEGKGEGEGEGDGSAQLRDADAEVQVRQLQLWSLPQLAYLAARQQCLLPRGTLLPGRGVAAVGEVVRSLAAALEQPSLQQPQRSILAASMLESLLTAMPVPGVYGPEAAAEEQAIVSPLFRLYDALWEPLLTRRLALLSFQLGDLQRQQQYLEFPAAAQAQAVRDGTRLVGEWLAFASSRSPDVADTVLRGLGKALWETASPLHLVTNHRNHSYVRFVQLNSSHTFFPYIGPISIASPLPTPGLLSPSLTDTGGARKSSLGPLWQHLRGRGRGSFSAPCSDAAVLIGMALYNAHTRGSPPPSGSDSRGCRPLVVLHQPALMLARRLALRMHCSGNRVAVGENAIDGIRITILSFLAAPSSAAAPLLLAPLDTAAEPCTASLQPHAATGAGSVIATVCRAIGALASHRATKSQRLSSQLVSLMAECAAPVALPTTDADAAAAAAASLESKQPGSGGLHPATALRVVYHMLLNSPAPLYRANKKQFPLFLHSYLYRRCLANGSTRGAAAAHPAFASALRMLNALRHHTRSFTQEAEQALHALFAAPSLTARAAMAGGLPPQGMLAAWMTSADVTAVRAVASAAAAAGTSAAYAEMLLALCLKQGDSCPQFLSRRGCTLSPPLRSLLLLEASLQLPTPPSATFSAVQSLLLRVPSPSEADRYQQSVICARNLRLAAALWAVPLSGSGSGSGGAVDPSLYSSAAEVGAAEAAAAEVAAAAEAASASEASASEEMSHGFQPLGLSDSPMALRAAVGPAAWQAYARLCASIAVELTTRAATTLRGASTRDSSDSAACQELLLGNCRSLLLDMCRCADLSLRVTALRSLSGVQAHMARHDAGPSRSRRKRAAKRRTPR